MKTSHFFKRALAFVAIGSLGFAISCSEDETPYEQEAAYVAEDVVTDFAFEDADDMAGLAMVSDDGTAGGRLSGEPHAITVRDHRFECDNLTVTITITNVEVPIGDIVIDFGEGCEDKYGNVRKGKILIHFEGKRFMPGSTVVTTFDGYSINGIVLGGIRTLTNIAESNVDAPAFRILLEEGSATWPDGSVATREHCFVRRWDFNTTFDPANVASFLDDRLIVSQCDNSDSWPHDYAAAGTNRRGRAYEMKILEELVYKRGCHIAVSGVKEFTDLASGTVITVDYGDGECDRIITITVNGQTRDVRVGDRG